jgi:hypothetical protein
VNRVDPAFIQSQRLNSGYHLSHSKKPTQPKRKQKISVFTKASRVLLINPPIYDVRLPWSHWIQPVTLLKLGNYLKTNGTDAWLLDALASATGSQLKRKRVERINLDGLAINKWRYGTSEDELKTQLQHLKKKKWIPDTIVVHCFTTIWWQGAQEVIALARKVFPSAVIVLSGAYPRLAYDHARAYSGADIILQDYPNNLIEGVCDHSLRENSFLPFGYVASNLAKRDSIDLVKEIKQMLQRGIRNIAFAEHDIIKHFPDLYRETLELLIKHKVRARFYALGNIDAGDLAKHPDLPQLMKKAGYKQISFADDRSWIGTNNELVENYKVVSKLVYKAGFKEGTDEINAGISVGRKGEDLSERSQLASQLVHHTGSIILWPYQPTPDEGLDLPLEMQNGKIFPYRQVNGYTYQDYINALGMGTVFNARYRGKSFNFLGKGFISKLFQESVARQGWNPDPEVKGGTQLPPRGPS